MSLGLIGPVVQMMIPVGGVIPRRHLGGFHGQGLPLTGIAEPTERAQRRALLAHVTSEDVPDPGPDAVYR